MAISTQGKLNELQKFKKTDGTIQNEYNKVYNKYKETKDIYKTSKQKYKLAQDELEMVKEELKNAPLTKKLKAKKKLKAAQKKLNLKKQKYILDREKYKLKLKELRILKSEIRSQYKAHRQYAQFFKKVQEAKKMGIKLPKYIEDEYSDQKSIYLSEKYSVDKTGKRSYITQIDNSFTKDVSTLIWEKHQQDMKGTLQNAVTQVKKQLNLER